MEVGGSVGGADVSGGVRVFWCGCVCGGEGGGVEEEEGGRRMAGSRDRDVKLH